MLLTKIKKTDLWFLPLFLIFFAFYYALFSNIKMKGIDHSVSIIVRAKIEKDDSLQFLFSTPDFGYSENNSKKIGITGSPDFQNIACTLPDFIKIKNIKLVFGSNINMPPIDIQKISIQKNNFNYSFSKNDIVKLFPITKGFLRDSITGKYRYCKEKGVFKPYLQSINIFSLYESVRLSNNQTPKTIIIVIAFFITLLTTLIIFFSKDFIKEKHSNYYYKPVIKIVKYKIELNRFNILVSLLVLFILYLLIFGDIKNDAFSIIKNDIALKDKYDPLESKIYDSIPLIPSNNLIYNGNFEHGLKFWTSDTDTANFSIIDTPFGKGVRITVNDAFGQNWFLKYNGRPIVYYPGHKYRIKFKYRIVIGNDHSFKIGWSITEKYSKFINAFDLILKRKNIGKNWEEVCGEYLFNTGHTDLAFFLHSLKSSTIIDVTDIQLIDLYNDKSLFSFLDQIGRNEKKVDQVFSNMLNSCKEQDNLIINGNFKNRLLNWHAYADSTTLDWITTPYGYGVRVHRTDGSGGWWSLFYTGPKIEYLANHSYFIEFKYHIVKGSKDPFNVGWWVKDNGKDFSPANLPLEITNLNNGWYKAKTKYTFINSHLGLPTIFNSLQDNSIVEFSDIKLTSDKP